MLVIQCSGIEKEEEVFIDYEHDGKMVWKERMANYEEPEWPLKSDGLKVEYKNKPFKTKTIHIPRALPLPLSSGLRIARYKYIGRLSNSKKI